MFFIFYTCFFYLVLLTYLTPVFFLLGILHARGYACSVCRVVAMGIALVWVAGGPALWLRCGPWPALIRAVSVVGALSGHGWAGFLV